MSGVSRWIELRQLLYAHFYDESSLTLSLSYIKTALTEVYTRDKAYSDYIIGRTPAGRWGLPEDFRGAIIFLASQSSNFVTGTSIVVDGGMLAK